MQDRSDFSRRLFVKQMAFAAAAFSTPGLMAEELTPTPRMTEGPFYPDKLPLDTDNDLIVLNDSLTPALGEITHLSGRVLNSSGEPLRNAFVEIWQVDHNGVYINSGDPRGENRDSNFQGYGRFLTDAKGQYYFRTIKPVPYPGRTPHIHFAISKNGRRVWTTQLLIKGHEQNERDGVFREIQDPKLRELVVADFNPIPDSKIGELAADFDVIVGLTPADDHDRKSIGGVGKSEWNRNRTPPSPRNQ
jgi:protocatechuate 3,4-dioxygenase, beta subunit